MPKKTTTIAELKQRADRRRALPTPIECRLLRLRARISQAEIAEIIGTLPSSVSRYETARRRPRGKILDKYLAVIESLSGEASHAKDQSA